MFNKDLEEAEVEATASASTGTRLIEFGLSLQLTHCLSCTVFDIVYFSAAAWQHYVSAAPSRRSAVVSSD